MAIHCSRWCVAAQVIFFVFLAGSFLSVSHVTDCTAIQWVAGSCTSGTELQEVGALRLHAYRQTDTGCEGEHALNRLLAADCVPLASGTRNQYVFMLSDLCRGGTGAPIRNPKDLVHSCSQNPHTFLSEIKYAIASMQAAGPSHGVTVLMHEGLRRLEVITRLVAWLQRRGAVVRFVPGKIDDPHMYYYMKSYIWDMTQYEKIAFFDSDFLFVRNPDAVFEACSADFCASANTRKKGILESEQRVRGGVPLRGFRFNAGFFVVTPNRVRGAEILETWRRCTLSENLCLVRAISRVQELSPRFNVQGVETNASLLNCVPAVAMHAKVDRMTCEMIEDLFGRSQCGAR